MKTKERTTSSSLKVSRNNCVEGMEIIYKLQKYIFKCIQNKIENIQEMRNKTYMYTIHMKIVRKIYPTLTFCEQFE